MHPILFEIGGFTLYTFGLLVGLAFVAAFALVFYRAMQAGDNVEHYTESALWLIIAGLVGARVFYFIFFPQYFWANPVAAIFSQGGLVWYGGMIGVTLAAIVFCRLKKLNLWRFGDIIIPGAAVGLAIGRIGCLMAGCCYGGPADVPWAIHYPHSHETRGLGVHPAPLYESLMLVVITVILLQVDKRKPFEGFTAWLFFVLLGAERFIVEYFRGDRLVWIESLNLSASQVISLGGMALGLGMIWWLSRRPRPVPALEPTRDVTTS